MLNTAYACSNTATDFYCDTASTGNSGSNLTFGAGKVTSCNNGWPSSSDYVSC